MQRRNRDGTLTDVNAPPCVSAYNKFMGGVDYADQKRADYKIPVKSRRWYRYLAIFFIETAAVNAFILRQLSPNHARTMQLKFRLELIDNLLGNYCSHKRSAGVMEVADGKTHFPYKGLLIVVCSVPKLDRDIVQLGVVHCVMLHCVLAALSHFTRGNTDVS